MPAWLTRIAVAAGFVCMGLRFWLLNTGLDERGLLDRSHPGNWLSWVILLLMGLLLVASLRTKGSARLVPSPKVAVGTILYGLGCLVAADSLYRGQAHPLHRPAAAVALVAALCTFWALYCLCRRKKVHPLIYAPGVLFFLMFLVCRYQNWNSEPEPQYCAFHILALAGLTVTAYIRGILAISRKNWKWYPQVSRWAIFASLAAIPGCADGLSLGLWALALALDGCELRKRQ